MNNRFIVARIQCQIPDDRGHTEMIGPHHQADNDHNKPFESSSSGKTGSENRQHIIHKF